MMRFHCPHCRHVLEVDKPTDALLCPACEQWCRIPIPDEFELSRAEAKEEPFGEPRLASTEQRRESITDRPSPVDRPLRLLEEEDVEDVDFEIVEDGDERRSRRVLNRGESRPKKGMKIRRRMGLTKLGLGFYYAKFLCTIAAITLSTVSWVFAVLPGNGAAVGAVASCLAIPTLAATPLLGLVGGLLCFWTPKKAKARLLIQISFGLDAGSLLASCISMIVALVGGFAAFAVLTLAGILAAVGACILFMLYLRALAYYLADSVVGDEAIHVMIRWLLVMVIPPLLLFAAVGAAVKVESILMAQIFIFIGLPIWIFLYVRVLLSLLQLIATIRLRIATSFDIA